MRSVSSEPERKSKMYTAISEPIDYGYLVYLVMFFEGVGNLFPWNALINASAYFGERFCGTMFESDFENFFSITYTVSQTIGLALSIKYQNVLSLRSKIIYPLLFYSIIFGITTLLVAVEVEPKLLFAITLLSAFVSGILGAILSGGLFGLGAMFPPIYTAALMNGQGLAGVVVSVSDMLTSLAGGESDFCDTDDDPTADGSTDQCPFSVNYSALAYFMIATIILMLCIVAYMYISKLHFTTYYINRAANGNIEKDADILNPFIDAPVIVDGPNGNSRSTSRGGYSEIRATDESENASGVTGGGGFVLENAIQADRARGGADCEGQSHGDGIARRGSRGSNNRIGDSRSIHVDGAEDHTVEETLDAVARRNISVSSSGRAVVDGTAASSLTLSEINAVFQQIIVPSLSVMFTFTVTIGLFPSLTVLLESTKKCHSSSDRLSNDLYVPLFFLLFNLFDFVGRLIAGSTTPYAPLFSAKNIWIPTVVRIALVPLFLLCNITDSVLPVVFKSDAFPITFMIVMALSNGYIATTCMMHGASMTAAGDSYLAGTIMIFSLTIGLFFGACTSFIVVYISQGTL